MQQRPYEQHTDAQMTVILIECNEIHGYGVVPDIPLKRCVAAAVAVCSCRLPA